MPSPPFVCIAQKGNAMPEQALQVAFEIKTACDEISRRLLRWHWEHKPGAHSLDALLEHIAVRKQESPDYYDRMPDLTGKTSWQQLDTTLCMRVLLDPETDAARALDLLGNTAHPSAARHACNAIRTARNEAAHAAVAADGAQAALLFNEAIEALEEGYAGTAFKENELAQYYREAEDYLSRCSEGKPLKARQSSPQNTQQGKAAARSKPRSAQQTRSTKNTAARSRSTGTKQSRGTASRSKKQQTGGESKAALGIILAVLVLGLIARAISMGLV